MVEVERLSYVIGNTEYLSAPNIIPPAMLLNSLIHLFHQRNRLGQRRYNALVMLDILKRQRPPLISYRFLRAVTEYSRSTLKTTKTDVHGESKPH